MSKDYRNDFIKEVENELVTRYSAGIATEVSDIIARVLSSYEITGRCTEIVPLDDRNMKLLKRYSACLLVDGKSKGTVRQYIGTLKKLSEKIQKPFPDMGKYDIRLFLAFEKERGISNKTLENTRSYISAFFQWMVNDEIILKNPIAGINRIKCTKKDKFPFSEVEIDALRSSCKNLKERAIFEILLSSGVRVSELASMEVKDINVPNLSIHVTHGKGDKQRMTYTTAVGMKHLLNYLENRSEKDGTALFYNMYHDPISISGIEKLLKTIAKRAGVDNVHPHRFRRTCATTLYKRGMPIQEIQKLLGHSNINTTMLYISILDTNVKLSYDKSVA